TAGPGRDEAPPEGALRAHVGRAGGPADVLLDVQAGQVDRDGLARRTHPTGGPDPVLDGEADRRAPLALDLDVGERRDADEIDPRWRDVAPSNRDGLDRLVEGAGADDLDLDAAHLPDDSSQCPGHRVGVGPGGHFQDFHGRAFLWGTEWCVSGARYAGFRPKTPRRRTVCPILCQAYLRSVLRQPLCVDLDARLTWGSRRALLHGNPCGKGPAGHPTGPPCTR